MVFVLGFLVSGLLTLLFLPAFWRRAVRLSTRQLETQMPLSMAEIVAERDQLRAGFAIDARRLEQKTDAVLVNRAADLAELGRRATHIAGLEAAIKARTAELAHSDTALGDTLRRLAEAETELGALHQAHWDASARADERGKALAALAAEHDTLYDVTDERRAIIAGLETRAAGLEVRLEDLQRRFDGAERDISENNMAIAKLAEERDYLRNETASAAARRDQLQAAAIELNQRIVELEGAHRIERRARARFENETASGVSALADSAAHSQKTEASFARQLEELSGREREMRQQIENLRAEKSSLEGALEVARREFALLRAERAPTPANEAATTTGVSAEDAAQLRQSITEIGADISRLVTVLQHEADERKHIDPPKPVGDRVRELQARGKRAVPSH